MAIYKTSSSFRANGASPPVSASASASASAPAPSQKNEKMKTRKHLTHSHSRKSSRSSAADSSSKFTANQTFTPEYRRQLCQKTLDLAATRTALNKTLSRASKTDKTSKNRLQHDKLLSRHHRLEKREKRHLATRTRALVELERKFKLDPTAERAKDLRLIKKLLLTFKRNLKANMEVRKNKRLRPAPGKSDSSGIIGDTDDSLPQGGSVAHETSIATSPEHSNSEEKANGTKRKRGASQRSNVSLTALFSQEDPEQTGNQAEEVVHAAKKTKKQKLNVSEPEKSSPVAPPLTKPVVNGKKTTTVSCSGALPADKPASPKGDKSGKKHPLPVDGEVKTKSKKAKVEEATSITPATSASPKASLDLPKPKHYHEQRVYDMLTDPLGFDDLVYEDTRPMNKRPKFRRFGFRYSKPDPNFSATMSGGLSLPESIKAVTKPRLANRLSNSVLKKSHNRKVAETVQGMKAKKNSSSLDTLTEKSKYSVNKESRYARTNGTGKSGTNSSIQQRKNKEHGRQQHLRSQYSTFTCPEVPDLIPTMTGAIPADDVGEDYNHPEPTMTSALPADDDDEESNYPYTAMTSAIPADDVDDASNHPEPAMTGAILTDEDPNYPDTSTTSAVPSDDVEEDSSYLGSGMTSSNLILVKPAASRTRCHSKVNVFPEPDRAWFKQPRHSGRNNSLQMFSSIPVPNSSSHNEEQLSHNDYDNDFSSHDATAGQVQLPPLSGKSGKESTPHFATGGIEADTPTGGLFLPSLFTPDASIPDDDFFDVDPFLPMLQSHNNASTDVVQGNETDMGNIDLDCELIRLIKPIVDGDDNNDIDTFVDTSDNHKGIGADDYDNTQQPLFSAQTDAAG